MITKCKTNKLKTHRSQSNTLSPRPTHACPNPGSEIPKIYETIHFLTILPVQSEIHFLHDALFISITSLWVTECKQIYGACCKINI